MFGPSKALAMLEGSKVYAKNIMKKYDIPTADFKIFDDPEEAKKYVKEKGAPLVIKADGLAAGKGVVVSRSLDEACGAIEKIMVKREFGPAGERIVIEERLEGEEVSVIVITDGNTILPLVSSRDHKRIGDNDKGPNTGGMGAYSPVQAIDNSIQEKIVDNIFVPLIRGLKREGMVYKGVLYGGLMIKDNVPRVLEFNVRFGDPETQVILPMLKSDLAQVMLNAIDGTLDKITLKWDEKFCLSVVLASGGYPGKYEKGKIISGLDKVSMRKDIVVFHAGTRKSEGETEGFVTSGGRVLNISGMGNTLEDARSAVYEAVGEIHFSDMYYRHDIGEKK